MTTRVTLIICVFIATAASALALSGACAARAVPVPGPDGWIDLLGEFNHATWQRDGAAVTSPAEGSTKAPIPFTTSASYDLEVRFARLDDGKSGVSFPVGGKVCHIFLGHQNGTAVSLRVQAQAPNTGPLTVKVPTLIAPGRAHTLLVKVKVDGETVDITLSLDGQQVNHWNGKQSAITSSSNWTVQPFTLNSFGAKIRFESVRIRPIIGGLQSCVLVTKDETEKKPAGTKEPAAQTPAVAAKPDSPAKPATAVELPKPVKGAAKIPPAASNSGWTDLLKNIDPVHTTATGKWSADGAGLTSGGDAASSTMTLGSATDGSYALQVKLTRKADGPDPATILLPAGAGSFAVGVGSKTITLGNVGGQSIPSAAGTVPDIPIGKECTLDVTVTLQKRNVEIAVLLDGKQVNGWLGPQSALTSPLGAAADPQAFALSTGKTKFNFTSVRVHPTTGTLRPSRAAAGAKPRN